MTRRHQRIHQQWSGMCPAGLHGLDYEGQACDVCEHDANPAQCTRRDCRQCWRDRGGRYPSATELELQAVARPDQPPPREPVDREQELAGWWQTWREGGQQ